MQCCPRTHDGSTLVYVEAPRVVPAPNTQQPAPARLPPNTQQPAATRVPTGKPSQTSRDDAAVTSLLRGSRESSLAEVAHPLHKTISTSAAAAARAAREEQDSPPASKDGQPVATGQIVQEAICGQHKREPYANMEGEQFSLTAQPQSTHLLRFHYCHPPLPVPKHTTTH